MELIALWGGVGWGWGYMFVPYMAGAFTNDNGFKVLMSFKLPPDITVVADWALKPIPFFFFFFFFLAS